jgi:hypothetical protein
MRFESVVPRAESGYQPQEDQMPNFESDFVARHPEAILVSQSETWAEYEYTAGDGTPAAIGVCRDTGCPCEGFVQRY